MTSLPFQFPALAFSPYPGRDGVPEREFLDHFGDPYDFFTCEEWKLEFRDGTMVADNDGLCWTIIGEQATLLGQACLSQGRLALSMPVALPPAQTRRLGG